MHLQGLNQPVLLPDQSNIELVSGGENILQYFASHNLACDRYEKYQYKHIPSSKTGDYELSKQFSDDIFSWFLQR